MKPIEKSKINKLIIKIESGIFDENDIDILFMKLRAYSKGFPVFKEIANFVAHNDIRNQGIANDALLGMYLRMKFFIEYQTNTSKKFDYFSELPLWIKKLFKLQIERCDEKHLREKFKVTKQRLISRIDNLFKDNKKDKTTLLTPPYSRDTIEALHYTMSILYGSGVFSQKTMIEELIRVLHSNKIEFNENRIRSLSDRITACTLLLFHNAEFDFSGYKTGFSNIESKNSSISVNTKFFDSEGNEVENTQTFGNLSIIGTVILNHEGDDLAVKHTIMSTDLATELWCAENLFSIEPLSDLAPGHLAKRLNLSSNLYLNEDFQFSCLIDQT